MLILSENFKLNKNGIRQKSRTNFEIRSTY